MSGIFEIDDFRQMVDGLKVRDAVAFAQFCDWFEGFLVRHVELQLRHLNLLWIEAEDICQEVLLRFWEICPRLIFDGAPAIRRYLSKMARSKILDLVRHSRADRRDAQRTQSVGWDGSEMACRRAIDPQDAIVIREFLERAENVLTSRQRQICEWRCADLGWPEIAARLDSTVDAAQKQLQRAFDRVSDDLHRDDSAYFPRYSR